MSADKPRVVSPNRNQLLLQPTGILLRLGRRSVDGRAARRDDLDVLVRHEPAIGEVLAGHLPRTPLDLVVDRYAPKRDDTPALAAWRVRMGAEDAKRVYVQRGVLAERTNADLRGHRGLDRMNVRGLAKVKTVVLLAALSFNALRIIAGGGLT
jgi:hypothetical protein